MGNSTPRFPGSAKKKGGQHLPEVGCAPAGKKAHEAWKVEGERGPLAVDGAEGRKKP